MNQGFLYTQIQRLHCLFNYRHVQESVKKTSYFSDIHWFASSDSIQQTQTSIHCCDTVRAMAVAPAAFLRLIPVRPDPMEQDSQKNIPHDLLRKVLSFQTTAQSMRFDSLKSFVVVIVFDECPTRGIVLLFERKPSSAISLKYPSSFPGVPVGVSSLHGLTGLGVAESLSLQ